MFLDHDCDGKGDKGEGGLGGVRIELIDSHGNVVKTTHSDHRGGYKFRDVKEGNYKLRFVEDTADGLELTKKDAAEWWRDSDADPDSGLTATFHVRSGYETKYLDAGFKEEVVKTGWVTGRVTHDDDCDNTEWNTKKDDNNRTYDEGDDGVKVELLDEHGNVVATTTTNHNGVYTFDAAEGKYRIRVEQPDGKEFAKKDVGSYTDDSDVDAHGVSDLFRIKAGKTTSNVDVSVKDAATASGSVSGRVFCDLDCDGIDGMVTTVEEPGRKYVIEAEDFHEKGFHERSASNASGHKIVRLDKAGGNGSLFKTFKGDTGTYDVKVVVQDENDGRSHITLKVNGHKVDAFKLDNDNNGGGSDNGHFSTFVIRDVAIKHGEELRFEVDGDGHEFARFDKVVLNGRKTVTEVEPEPGKEGVEVKLIDADGNVVARTKTDANGHYKFDDVPVGDYKIMVTAPDGTEFTLKDAGNDDRVDSDVNAAGMSGTFTVREDQDTEIDAGLKDVAPTASVSGRYFCDENGNDVDDEGDSGVAGATVVLLDADGAVVATTTTDETGAYSFTGLEAGRYSVRFEDPDDVAGSEGKAFVAPNAGDNDADDSDVTGTDGNGDGTTDAFDLGRGETKENVDAGIADPGDASLSGQAFCDDDCDGIRDDGEDAVSGVRVELLNAAGAVIAMTTTGEDGSYAFTGLDAGDYQVRFVESTAGPKELTFKDEGDNDARDSDADPATGLTDTISLGRGEAARNVDAGFKPLPGSIGGRVFEDDDCDGIEEAGEAGLEGILVALLDAEGDVVTTTTTDSDGKYSFDDVETGTYMVQVASDNEEFVFAKPDQGDDDTVDSDIVLVDDNGFGKTGDVFVAPGADVTDVDAALCNICIEVCIDFEEFAPGTIVSEIEVGGITAYVSVDGQRQAPSDPNEPFIDNGSQNDAMIFDSTAQPATGDDEDLTAFPEQGSILILTEDDDGSDPDDAEFGGTITFEFDEAVDMQSITVIDANPGSTISANGVTIAIPDEEDGDRDIIDLSSLGDVTELTIFFSGSGAIDDLKFEVCDPSFVDGLVPMTH